MFSFFHVEFGFSTVTSSTVNVGRVTSITTGLATMLNADPDVASTVIGVQVDLYTNIAAGVSGHVAYLRNGYFSGYRGLEY